MRTAIIISGHIRTWLDCKINFLESFNHLNPDVFVSTYDLQYNYHPAGRHWMGNSPDNYLTTDEIHHFFDGVNVINFDIENINDVIIKHNHDKQFLHPNFKEETHTVLQYRKIIKTIEYIVEYENKINLTYDVIIKIRPDIYHKKFTYTTTDNNIIVSDKNVFPNDVLIASNHDEFIKIFDFIKTEFYNPIYENSHLRAPHNLLLAACEYNNFNISKVDMMDHVVRKTGKNYYEELN